MIRLDDRVDLYLEVPGEPDPYSGDPTMVWILEASDVPAQVGYTTVERTVQSDRTTFVEQLRAVLEPREQLPQRIDWRGTLYEVDGVPMIRRLHGNDHHLTIPLKRAVG